MPSHLTFVVLVIVSISELPLVLFEYYKIPVTFFFCKLLLEHSCTHFLYIFIVFACFHVVMTELTEYQRDDMTCMKYLLFSFFAFYFSFPISASPFPLLLPSPPIPYFFHFMTCSPGWTLYVSSALASETLGYCNYINEWPCLPNITIFLILKNIYFNNYFNINS